MRFEMIALQTGSGFACSRMREVPMRIRILTWTILTYAIALIGMLVGIAFLGNGARAQSDGADRPEDPLQDFTGIWARTSNRCDLNVRKITGFLPLSLRNVDKATANKYHLIGICGNGFDLIRQPVGCIASKVVERNKIVELSAACRVKDYPTKHLKIRIGVLGKDRITFNKEDFDEDYFYIAGEYRRCSRSFACEEGPGGWFETQHPRRQYTVVAIDWTKSYEGPLYDTVLDVVPGVKEMAEAWDGVILKSAQVDLDGDGKSEILARTPVVMDGLYPGYPGDPTAIFSVGADGGFKMIWTARTNGIAVGEDYTNGMRDLLITADLDGYNVFAYKWNGKGYKRAGQVRPPPPTP